MSHSSKSGQARGLGAGEGALVPQFFAEQLTLSLTGGQIMPTIVLQAPLDFQTLRRPWIVFTLVPRAWFKSKKVAKKIQLSISKLKPNFFEEVFFFHTPIFFIEQLLSSQEDEI